MCKAAICEELIVFCGYYWKKINSSECNCKCNVIHGHNNGLPGTVIGMEKSMSESIISYQFIGGKLNWRKLMIESSHVIIYYLFFWKKQRFLLCACSETEQQLIEFKPNCMLTNDRTISSQKVQHSKFQLATRNPIYSISECANREILRLNRGQWSVTTHLI